MLLPVAAVLVGMVVGLLAGGRLRHVRRTRVRWPGLVVAGLALRLAVDAVDLGAPEVVLAASTLALLVAAARNLHLPGAGVVAVGLVAVLAPLLANGALPVEGSALVHAGVVTDQGEPDVGPGRVLVGDDTALAPLAERIPVPELRTVLSFGDLVVLVGLVAIGARSTRRRHSGGVPARVLIDQLASGAPAPGPATMDRVPGGWADPDGT